MKLTSGLGYAGSTDDHSLTKMIECSLKPGSHADPGERQALSDSVASKRCFSVESVVQSHQFPLSVW